MYGCTWSRKIFISLKNEIKLDYFCNWMDVIQSNWVRFVFVLDFYRKWTFGTIWMDNSFCGWLFYWDNCFIFSLPHYKKTKHYTMGSFAVLECDWFVRFNWGNKCKFCCSLWTYTRNRIQWIGCKIYFKFEYFISDFLYLLTVSKRHKRIF